MPRRQQHICQALHLSLDVIGISQEILISTTSQADQDYGKRLQNYLAFKLKGVSFHLKHGKCPVVQFNHIIKMNPQVNSLNPCVANKLWHYDIYVYVSLWLSLSNSSSKKCQWPIYHQGSSPRLNTSEFHLFWSKTWFEKKTKLAKNQRFLVGGFNPFEKY